VEVEWSGAEGLGGKKPKGGKKTREVEKKVIPKT
jgi:hypothetical protein